MTNTASQKKINPNTPLKKEKVKYPLGLIKEDVNYTEILPEFKKDIPPAPDID